MNEVLFRYKGFVGSKEVDAVDGCYFGKILHIDGMITYEGQSHESLEAAFREAVDHYIELCANDDRSSAGRVAGI